MIVYIIHQATRSRAHIINYMYFPYTFSANPKSCIHPHQSVIIWRRHVVQRYRIIFNAIKIECNDLSFQIKMHLSNCSVAGAEIVKQVNYHIVLTNTK